MNQLPEGWKVAPLKELIDYVIGGDWGKDENYQDEKFTLVNCIRGAEFRYWTEEKGATASLRRIKISSLKNRQIKEGDILIEISGGGPEQPVGRTVLITKEVLSNFEYPVVCTNFLRLIRPSKIINSCFLNYYLNYFYFSGDVISYQAGSNNLRNLKFKEYEKISIPIPPIETQTAIVSKIESLFAEIDAGIACLKKARQQLAHYRQALLKNAFSGKLTEQWRASHAHQKSTELLTQIQTARAQHYQSQLVDWQAAVEQWEAAGKTGKKPGKPKAPSVVAKYEAGEDLPSGWVRVALSEISDIGSGMSVSSNRKLNHPITVNYLRVGNVQRGYLSLSEIKEMQIESNHLEKYRLKFGDVLFNEGGDRDKLGRGWIWQNEIENCITQNHVFRAIPFIKSIYFSKYISYLGNSQYGKRYFEETGKQTNNLASINKNVLSTLFLLPS